MDTDPDLNRLQQKACIWFDNTVVKYPITRSESKNVSGYGLCRLKTFVFSVTENITSK